MLRYEPSNKRRPFLPRSRKAPKGTSITIAKFDGSRTGKCYTGHILDKETGAAGDTACQWMFLNDEGDEDLIEADKVVILESRCPAYLKSDEDWQGTAAGDKYIAAPPGSGASMQWGTIVTCSRTSFLATVTLGSGSTVTASTAGNHEVGDLVRVAKITPSTDALAPNYAKASYTIIDFIAGFNDYIPPSEEDPAITFVSSYATPSTHCGDTVTP